MNKSDIVGSLAFAKQCSKADAAANLDTLLEIISDALGKGESVSLFGFGVFSVKRREARSARNPRTGEKIEIKASAVPVFKAGKTLKSRVK